MSAEPITSAQRVDHIREQLRYRIADARDLWVTVQEIDPLAAEGITSATLLMDAAARRLFRVYERLLERR